MISIITRLISSITTLTILATILRVFSRLRKFLSRGLIRYQSNEPSDSFRASSHNLSSPVMATSISIDLFIGDCPFFASINKHPLTPS
jgi:hypothetical protein